MEIYNDINIICTAEVADTLFSRALGLMFRKRLGEDNGLLIKFSSRLKSSSIHSFFMRFPIDLIFINRDKTVTEVVTLKPWSVYTPKKQCAWVLEVNEGIAAKKNVRVGDVLRFGA